jgi:hypothetical protein
MSDEFWTDAQKIPKRFLIDIPLLMKAIRDDDPDTALHFLNAIHAREADFAMMITKHGKMRLFKWIVFSFFKEKPKMIPITVLVSAAFGGHVDILEWAWNFRYVNKEFVKVENLFKLLPEGVWPADDTVVSTQNIFEKIKEVAKWKGQELVLEWVKKHE